MPAISAISSTSSSIAPSSSAISRSNSRECPSRRYLSFATCSARACPMNHGVHARSSSSPDGVSFVVVHRGGQSDNRLRAFPSPDGRRWMRARARRERAWGAARRDASDADARAGTSTTERVFAIDVRARRARALDIVSGCCVGCSRHARRRVGCCVGRCVPPDCLRIRPTDRTLDESRRFSPATRRRPPLVDARGTRRESRDAIKNIIIARARRSSFVDVIARARSPAPARVVDRARFRSSSGRRLRRLSCCARSVVVVVQPISRDS